MPALLEPPPTRPRVRGTVFPPRPPPDPRWHDRFVRSGYFFGAVLLHLVIFALVATYVVWPAPHSPPPDDPIKINIPPAKQQPVVTGTLIKMPVNPTPATSDNAEHLLISTTANPSDFTIHIPVPGSAVGPHPSPLSHFHIIDRGGPSHGRLQIIQRVEEGPWHRPHENIIEGGGDPSVLEARFAVYLASYADGDWACNTVLDGQGHIVAGALPNLLAKVREWSHNKIKATVEPQPLAIGSPDLLEKMPPFIFFTGHKDFRLTDTEIANLRQYLQNGGLIWGDNALPGYGSRFDVAFRREMKRVIPDKDKPFEDVPMDHPMFNKNKWFDFDGQLPMGMNYFKEPMQHIDLDGIMAILYTPNDYSDMMDLRIREGDQSFEGGWHRGLDLWSNEIFLNNSELYFRNFNLSACYQSQRLAANIIGYLLVRFDDPLLLNTP